MVHFLTLFTLLNFSDALAIRVMKYKLSSSIMRKIRWLGTTVDENQNIFRKYIETRLYTNNLKTIINNIKTCTNIVTNIGVLACTHPQPEVSLHDFARANKFAKATKIYRTITLTLRFNAAQANHSYNISSVDGHG